MSAAQGGVRCTTREVLMQSAVGVWSLERAYRMNGIGKDFTRKVAFEQYLTSPGRRAEGGAITSKGLEMGKHRGCFEINGKSVLGHLCREGAQQWEV